MQAITEKVKPLVKKNSRYFMIGLPMMVVSFMNLFFLFIQGGWNQDRLVPLGIYALLAAIGMALFKESKHINKKMQEIGAEHIIERIHTSEHMNEYKKKEYITLVKEQPKLGLQTFINFLTEENQRKQRMLSE